MSLLIYSFVAFTLGALLPALIIFGIVIRAIQRFRGARWPERSGWIALLCPLAYLVFQVVVHGPVTRTPDWEGPTVNPLFWFALGFGWYVLENERKKSDSRRKNHRAVE